LPHNAFEPREHIGNDFAVAAFAAPTDIHVAFAIDFEIAVLLVNGVQFALNRWGGTGNFQIADVVFVHDNGKVHIRRAHTAVKYAEYIDTADIAVLVWGGKLDWQIQFAVFVGFDRDVKLQVAFIIVHQHTNRGQGFIRTDKLVLACRDTIIVQEHHKWFVGGKAVVDVHWEIHLLFFAVHGCHDKWVHVIDNLEIEHLKVPRLGCVQVVSVIDHDKVFAFAFVQGVFVICGGLLRPAASVVEKYAPAIYHVAIQNHRRGVRYRGFQTKVADNAGGIVGHAAGVLPID